MKNKKKEKHIVHVVHSFFIGGLENGMVNIINRLSSKEYFHTIICVTAHDPNFFARIKNKNVQIIDLKKPPGKGFLWLLKCWKLFITLKPDVCHTRNLSAIEAQLPAFFARVPFRVHGEHGWDINDLGGKNKKYQALRRFFKRIIHQYVALSSEAENYLLKTIKVRKNKLIRICNGVDIQKFTPNKNRALLPTGFSNEDSIIFGTVGRLARVKNQAYIVEAFITLWLENPDYREKMKLMVVGDGILLPELEEAVERSGVKDSVWFVGQSDDVNKLMQQMDVFVLPSLAEGVSNTILEAMATGLPVIATNVGGNSDLIIPRHIGTHIVEVNQVDKLVSIMASYLGRRSELIRDSKSSREHCVENFSLEVMVNKYHQLYQKLN